MKITKYLFNNKLQIQIFLLCLIAFTLFFKVKHGNIAIITAFLLNILLLRKEVFFKLKHFAIIFPLFFFLITIISSVFSKRYIEGFEHTDLELLLVLITIILVSQNITKAVLQKVLKYFYYGAVLSTTILLINSAVKFYKGKGIGDIIFHNFTLLYDQHPVYFSICLSIALFFSIINQNKEVINNQSKKHCFNAIIVLGIILSASKAVIAINFFSFLIYFFFKAGKNIKNLLYGFLLLFSFVIVFNISFVKERFIEGLKFEETISTFKPTNDILLKKRFDYDEKTQISDLELRYIIGQIGIYHLIDDDKLYFGYGQGDTQYYLDYYYHTYNLAPNWYEGLNLHNQYLHILVTYGVFVLLLFISYLIYSFYFAIKYRQLLHLFFLIMIAFVFFFEVILVRNKGIVLFYFLNTLFLLNTLYFESSNNRNKRNS